MLRNTHALVVDDDRSTRLILSSFLEELGATVHVAESQIVATGMYFRLFSKGIKPRLVICDWWLTEPNGKEWEFLAQIGRLQDDASARHFITEVRHLDPPALISVYTNDVKAAQDGLADHPTQDTPLVMSNLAGIEIVSKTLMSPRDYVRKLAMDERINLQRMTQMDVDVALDRAASDIGSGGYLRMRTPANG